MPGNEDAVSGGGTGSHAVTGGMKWVVKARHPCYFQTEVSRPYSCGLAEELQYSRMQSDDGSRHSRCRN